jgi:RHS repeat-associated protein
MPSALLTRCTATGLFFGENQRGQILEERVTGYGARTCQYVWHPYYIDALAVRYYDADTDGSSAVHYCLQDANYNVTAVVDDGGDVVERYQYTPYGEVTFLNPDFSLASSQYSSAIGNTHLYTGRERDSETGLQLNRHRYYASHLGRWLTRDPPRKGDAALFTSREWCEYAYNGLHRLKAFDRGNLAGTAPNYTGVTSTSYKQDFTLDQLGNWSTFKDDAEGNGWDFTQTRTHNAANEITQIDSSTAHVAEDAAGNMTKIPQPGNWSADFALKYDAWNRLVQVDAGPLNRVCPALS